MTALDLAVDPGERFSLTDVETCGTPRGAIRLSFSSRAHALEDAETKILNLQTTAPLARVREAAVLERKVLDWKTAVERMDSSRGP